jgi:hypothetical protein
MSTTHELIVLPEKKEGPGAPPAPPVLRDRRAVLLVSTTSTDPSGEHRLAQRAFFGHQLVLTLETLVGTTRIHLTDNLDFNLASEDLRSRGLGGLLLRRAVDFAFDKAHSTSILVRSILLSPVDEADPENAVRRDAAYVRIGFNLQNLPASRQLQQPLSQFSRGLGVPAGVEVLRIDDEAFYAPFIAQQNSRLNSEDYVAAKATWSRVPGSPSRDEPKRWYASLNPVTATAGAVAVFAVLGLGWLAS